MHITRRALLTHVGLATNPNYTGVRRVNNNHPPTLSTNTLYVYERDRFRAMYMIENDNDESCFVVKHRVDWYDQIEEKPRSNFQSIAYITDTGGEN